MLLFYRIPKSYTKMKLIVSAAIAMFLPAPWLYYNYHNLPIFQVTKSATTTDKLIFTLIWQLPVVGIALMLMLQNQNKRLCQTPISTLASRSIIEIQSAIRRGEVRDVGHLVGFINTLPIPNAMEAWILTCWKYGPDIAQNSSEVSKIAEEFIMRLHYLAYLASKFDKEMQFCFYHTESQ